MASHSAVFSVGPKTLSSTTVDTVTLSSTGDIDVHNYTESGTDLSVTVGRGTAPDDPVAGANDTWCIPAGRSRTIKLPAGESSSSSVIVKVKGNGNSYGVEVPA